MVRCGCFPDQRLLALEEKRRQRPTFRPLFMQMMMLRQKGSDLSKDTQTVRSRAKPKLKSQGPKSHAISHFFQS